ncbi:MAG: hypothetical protein IJX30_04520 [Clostridia bacterium]|nr:hypothetical protein [Clostridia bacterium]
MENFIYKLYAGGYYEESYEEEEFLTERNEKIDKVMEIREQPVKEFSGKQKKLLEQLLSADAEVWIYEEECLFARGIKLGMLL